MKKSWIAKERGSILHGWIKFSRDFVIIKKGEIEEVSSALTPWPGCFDDYKVQVAKRKKEWKMKKLARSSEDCNSLVLLSC